MNKLASKTLSLVVEIFVFLNFQHLFLNSELCLVEQYVRCACTTIFLHSLAELLSLFKQWLSVLGSSCCCSADNLFPSQHRLTDMNLNICEHPLV